MELLIQIGYFPRVGQRNWVKSLIVCHTTEDCEHDPDIQGPPMGHHRYELT